MLSVTCKNFIFKISNRTYTFGRFAYKRHHSSKTNPKPIELDSKVLELLEKHENKILYNTVLNKQRVKMGLKFRRKVSVAETIKTQKSACSEIDGLAISLKYLSDDLDVSRLQENRTKRPVREKYQRTHFPFEESIPVDESDESENNVKSSSVDVADDLIEEVRLRQESYKSINCNHWMTDYENFDDNLQNSDWKVNYGIADPAEPVSNVPCGGCGALLHCKVN